MGGAMLSIVRVPHQQLLLRIAWDLTRWPGRGAEAGLEEAGLRSVRRGKGAAKELPALVSRGREVSV